MTGDKRAVVAVDVGGTTMKAGILGPSGLYELRRVPSQRERGPEAVLDTVADVVTALLGRCRELELEAVGVGVVVPGIVDDAGVGRYSVTLGWHNLPIRDCLIQAIGQPIYVGHDVRAGALAEAAFGAAVEERTSLFVSLGTGVASAIVRDRVVVMGDSFQAGELGQVLVAAPLVGAPKNVGPTVTLEATSSARAIAECYARAAGLVVGSVDAEAVAAAVADGDAHAVAVWSEAIDRLGLVLATAIAIVDPGVVVVGGGLSRAGASFVDPLVASIATFLPWREPPRVTTARFADDAGFVGCAINAWQVAGPLDIADLADVLVADEWRNVLAAVEV